MSASALPDPVPLAIPGPSAQTADTPAAGLSSRASSETKIASRAESDGSNQAEEGEKPVLKRVVTDHFDAEGMQALRRQLSTAPSNFTTTLPDREQRFRSHHRL